MYKVELTLEDGRVMDSILFEEEPTKSTIEEAKRFYKGKSHKIIQVDNVEVKWKIVLFKGDTRIDSDTYYDHPTSKEISRVLRLCEANSYRVEQVIIPLVGQ